MRSSSIPRADVSGQPDAATLFGALYAELHRLAKRQLARGYSDASLGVTTLLHEAYLDISSRHAAVFADEAHFMGYAARVMRGLIIDHARAQHAAKRGGEFELTSLKTDDLEVEATPRQLGAISDALDELATFDPALAEIVDLKFFCGFSFVEIGAMRGMSERSVQLSGKGRASICSRGFAARTRTSRDARPRSLAGGEPILRGGARDR